jgi:hypothetical protein
MGKIARLPIPAPFATEFLERFGNRGKPAIRFIPTMDYGDNVNRKTIAMPAIEVGRRIGNSLCRWYDGAASRIVQLL